MLYIDGASVWVSNSSRQASDAVVVSNDPQSPCCSTVVNGSFCHISSLEVYRGREAVFRIQHDGLSLSDRGMLEVRNRNSHQVRRVN